jgi:hypothetical protein
MRRISDIFLPLFFSIFIHFFFLYLVFYPGNGKNHLRTSQVSVNDKLDAAETFVSEEIQKSRERIMRKIGEVNVLKREAFSEKWTKNNMPARMKKVFERIDRNLSDVEVTPSLFKKKDEFSILVKVITTPRLVFEDIILLSYIVGDGTLHSDFNTDYLLLALKEKGSAGSRDFIVTTMDCRLLYAKKLSAQQFIRQATIEEGKHW